MSKDAFIGFKINDGEVTEIRGNFIELTGAFICPDASTSLNDSQGLFDNDTYITTRSHVERVPTKVQIENIVSVHPINKYIGDVATGHIPGNFFRYPKAITQNSDVFLKSRIIMRKVDGTTEESCFTESPDEVIEKINRIKQLPQENNKNAQSTNEQLLDTVRELTERVEALQKEILKLKPQAQKPPRR